MKISRWIKFLLITTVLLVSSVAVADDKQVVEEEFLGIFNKSLKILNDKSLSDKEKYKKVIDSSDKMFDFELMAKLSLGRNWGKLTHDQQDEFVLLYKTKMQQSYSSKIDSFSNSKVKINFIKQTKPTKIVMYTVVQDNKNNSFDVDFKFYKQNKDKDGNIEKPAKNSWLIYDVLIKGVSIIKSDRAQFNSILNRGAVNNLMDKMREK